MPDALSGLIGFLFDPNLIANYGWRIIDGLGITVIVVGT